MQHKDPGGGHHHHHHEHREGHGATKMSKAHSSKPKPWCVPHSRKIEWSYEVTANEVGRGSFGVTKICVARATENNDPAVKIWTPGNGEECVLKEIHKVKGEGYREMINGELEVFKLLTPHPGFPKLYDLYEDREKVYFIMENCKGGELADAIVKKGSFREKDAAYLFRQVLKAVAHMHTLGYVHRDIKPQNFLLAQDITDVEDMRDVRVCCADFGLATQTQAEDMLEDCSGTLSFMSPEQLSGNPYKGQPADVWSCGVILYILLSGHLPFDGPTSKIVQTKIRGAMLAFQPDNVWREVSSEAKDLIQKLMMLDWEHRLTTDEALEHPWFDSCIGSDVGSNGGGALDTFMFTRLQQFNKWGKLKKAASHQLAMMLSRHISNELALDVPVEEEEDVSDEGEEGGGGGLIRSRSRTIYDFLSNKDDLKKHLLDYRNAFEQIERMNPESGTKSSSGAQAVSAAQLMKSMKQLGFKADARGIEDLVKSLDMNNDNVIDYEEFLSGTLRLHYSEYMEILGKVFREFDEDDDGFITVEELKKALMVDGEEEEERMKAIIAVVDVDENGNLDYSEFLEAFQKGL